MTYQPGPPYPPHQPMYWRPEAPRPGCVPLRPLGVGDILDGSIKAVRRNPRTMLGASAIVSVVQVALTTIFQIFALHQLGDAKVDQADGTQTINLGSLFGGELTSSVGLLIQALLSSILTGFLVVVVTQDVLGRTISARDAWARVRPRLGALVGLSLLTTIIQFLALIPCLVLGVWLWGIWAVAVPALIIENTSIRGAWGRSSRLVDGTFWRVWGIRALGVLLVTIISGMATVPFEIIGLLVTDTSLNQLTDGTQPVAVLLIASIGALIAATVTAPIVAAIQSLLYVDLRMRKEGLDLVLQQSASPTAR